MAVTEHLCVGVVASPVRPDAGLPAKIPDLELDVFVRDRLNIESNGCTKTLLCELMIASRHSHRYKGEVRGLGSRLHEARKQRTWDCGDNLSDLQSICATRPGASVGELVGIASARLGEGRGTGGGSHRMVVFPALSRPSTKILASFSPKRLSSLDIHSPISACSLDAEADQ